MPDTPRRFGAKDQIYAHTRAEQDFRFDAEVAHVFEDMITRSIPGYASLIHGIGVWGRHHAHPHLACYDLGCSLGAAARTWAAHLEHSGPIIGIDSSADMIARARELSGADIIYECADLRDVTLQDSSVIALNLTLQFLPVEDRLDLLRRIAECLHPDGALILTEKVRFEDSIEQRMADQYEAFKRSQGYSQLEISQKRVALENTLIRDSLDTHLGRLKRAGFNSVTIWFQCLNFISMRAQRRSAPTT